MAMILGLSSFTYGWSIGTDTHSPGLNEHDLLRKTHEFDLKCLQVGDNLPLHLFSTERLKEFKAAISKNNIRLEVGARKLTENHLYRYLEIATFLEAPLLRFVIDENGYKPADGTIISILKNCLPELKKRKIILGIENHDRFKARGLASMMETIGDEHIGICLDCVNSMGAGEGLEWVANMLVPYTVNLHIKDFSIQRMAHNMGFTIAGAPTGTGMLNLSWIIEQLSLYNRCRSAILEQWVIPEATLDETIKKEHAWAEQGTHYLKRLPFFNTNTLS